MKVYDSLHGISTDVVELSEAVEILAYCLMDGKVDQKSSFESCLYNDLLEQLKNNEVRVLPGKTVTFNIWLLNFLGSIEKIICVNMALFANQWKAE